MICQALASLLHIYWCHLFVTEYGWDLHGLGLAINLTSLLLLLTTVMYTHRIKEIQDALFWPDATVFEGWREYFKLGVPTTVMLLAEYWAWQFLAILSGIFGVLA